jgi:phenylacetate-CoA ligase
VNAAARAIHTGRLFFDCMRERRVPFYSPDRIREIQTRRVRSIVKYAYEHVSYYRDVMRGLSLTLDDIRDADGLRKLPVISKADVRYAQSAFQSRLHPPEKCVMLSSTLGGRTCWDPESALRRMALLERDRAVWTRLARLRPGHTRLAIVPETSSVHTQQSFVNARTIQSRLWARREWHDASLPFSTLVDALERVRPHLPSVWYYGGDMPAPGCRERIEKAYGCKTYSAYATTEVGRIGFECELGRGFHINEDLMDARVVDAAGQEVPDGTTGEIVISCLYNPATVLLNYRIGDLGAISREKCEGGRNFARIVAFEGRKSEVIELADGRTVPVAAFLGRFDEDVQGALRVRVLAGGMGGCAGCSSRAPERSASGYAAGSRTNAVPSSANCSWPRCSSWTIFPRRRRGNSRWSNGAAALRMTPEHCREHL